MALDKEGVMVEYDIIGIANDRARNKKELCYVWSQWHEYKDYNTKYPHLHLRQLLEVTSNFKIPEVTDDAFKIRLFSILSKGQGQKLVELFRAQFHSHMKYFS